MTTSQNSINLLDHLEDQIKLGYSLEANLLQIENKNIKGFAKLHSRIKSEIKYLEKLRETPLKIKKSNIGSSNLKNLAYFVDILKTSEDVVGVLQKKRICKSDDFADELVVDIISQNGFLWTKVIARNFTGLMEMYKERKSPTSKSMLHTICQFKDAAENNKILYQTPEVVFNFLSIPHPLAAFILKYGIAIKSDNWIETDPKDYQFDSDDSDSDCDLNFKELNKDGKVMLNKQESKKELKTANLDITALICLVSNLSNGFNNFNFEVPIIVQQAEEEKVNPVLPPLKEFLKEKELLVCETALNAFKSIVNFIGGPHEKERTEKLLKGIRVIPDNPSNRINNIPTSAKVNNRAKIIFGTGDNAEAITVTANTGFVRAVQQLGVSLSVFEHRAIALSESKENAKQEPN